MSFKACIFDLDGTLCDSVESIACSANHALRDFGMKEATIEEYKVFVGDGVDTLIRRLLRFGGDEACEGFEKVRDRYMEYFKEGCLYNVKPYPGIVATLKELKKQGAKIAVLSNKPDANTKNVIRTVFPEGNLFDWIQGSVRSLPEEAGSGRGAPYRGAVWRKTGGMHVPGRYQHGYEDRNCSGHVHRRRTLGIPG